jgi:hypothetical protein
MSQTLTREQAVEALRKVMDSIADTVREAGPLGAPAGPMYAALQTQGCTLNQFNSITDGMVRSGRLRREGDLFFIPDPKPA